MAEHQESVENEVASMSDDDEDRNLRERLGDAIDDLGDRIRGRDDDVDPEVKVHLIDPDRGDDRVAEDER